MALLPIVIIVMFATSCGLMIGVPAAAGKSMKQMYEPESLLPLLFMFPGIMLGSALGLMSMNLVAFCIPALRRIFDREAAATGRHGFSKAMQGLGLFAAASGLVTIGGAFLFLWLR